MGAGTAASESHLTAAFVRLLRELGWPEGRNIAFGPELVYIRSVDGAVADKHAYIESMRSGTVKYRAMRRSDVRVRTYGCLAMTTGFFELDLTVRGGELSEQTRFHSVWAKRGQGLQFVSWQSTRVPPKQ